jgi:membrane fusion protein (multidrug efflux system)
MKGKNVLTWAMVLGTMVGLSACGGDAPQAPMTSYETVTIKKEDITVPIKFSAKLKGETDVTITPQVSGQLMRICVTEGDLVKKGQVLFIIDQLNEAANLYNGSQAVISLYIALGGGTK